MDESISNVTNKQMMTDLLSLFVDYDHVRFFVNCFGAVGVTIASPYVSVFIEKGHYHLALSDHRYRDWLSLAELKSLLEDEI